MEAVKIFNRPRYRQNAAFDHKTSSTGILQIIHSSPGEQMKILRTGVLPQLRVSFLRD